MTPDIAIVGGGPAGLALGGILERAGLSYIIYERSAKDTPPRGGCLDLHVGSGQLAMKEAGCWEKFNEYGRRGDATIAQVWDHKGNKVFTWGEGADAPELDRHQIKKALLTTIPEEKILWRKTLTSAERNEMGKVVLTFDDGSIATGFKLVVGADGTWSKVRHLVTSTNPYYAGVTFLSSEILPTNPAYPSLEKMIGLGAMVVMGKSAVIWAQKQGSGNYRAEFGKLLPEDFYTNGKIDLTDTEAVKKMLLSDDFYGHHADEIKTIIKAADKQFRAWPLYYTDLDALNWSSASGVTLIGDAAHNTTPFAGEGANMAMLDSVTLVRKLKEFGISQQAISEYEKEMFPYAKDVIHRSTTGQRAFFARDSPNTFFEILQKTPFIKFGV